MTVAGLKKRKPNYYLTSITIALVLFLFGLFGLIALNANALIRYFKENIEIHVEIKNDTDKDEIKQFQQELAQKDFIKKGSLDYIPKEDGAEFMKKAFGDDFVKYGLENPLLDILRFNVNAKDLTPKKLASIKKDLESRAFVDYVFYEEVQVANVVNNVYKLGGITFIIGLFFALITYILINNTVRLALYSNRFLIKNMQLVGATPAFITKPYMMRSMQNGAISGLLAIAGLGILVYYSYQTFPELILFQDRVNLLILALVVLFVGIGISAMSTRLSMNKFLKLPIEDLY